MEIVLEACRHDLCLHLISAKLVDFVFYANSHPQVN